MLATIDTIRKEATKQLNPNTKGELGQFMTPGIIAEFMASLFQKCDGSIQLLDAGAGVGSLTIAFLERMKSVKSPQTTHITAYEIDPMLLRYMKSNLDTYKVLYNITDNLEFNIFNRDFIEDAVSEIKSNKDKIFTHAILNPPYKKINSQSDHRKLLSSVDIETVNLYSAFVSLALMLLKDKGELVAIIPRSFCNGNYYRPFRNLITKNAAITRIHLFDSRNQAFKEDDVLQENIIIHLIKSGKQGTVTVSRSTNETLQDLTEQDYRYDQIVKQNDSEAFIHIPAIEKDHLDDSDAIKNSLLDLNLTVSTGPVVDFRSKEYIFRMPGEGMVPLLYPMHFNGKEMDWPKEGKKPNAIIVNDQTRKMLYPAGYYVVVKRFSSKEEKQRIVARVINPEKIKGDFLGFENHLNVFHTEKKGISEDLAYGLAAYLNSTIVDIHFRSFNGHTQVNATDLRQIKYPCHAALLALGKWAKTLKSFDQSKIDEQIKKIL